MAENTVVYYGTGRRKEAVARVRLIPGTGEWKINGRTPTSAASTWSTPPSPPSA